MVIHSLRVTITFERFYLTFPIILIIKFKIQIEFFSLSFYCSWIWIWDVLKLSSREYFFIQIFFTEVSYIVSGNWIEYEEPNHLVQIKWPDGVSKFKKKHERNDECFWASAKRLAFHLSYLVRFWVCTTRMTSLFIHENNTRKLVIT